VKLNGAAVVTFAKPGGEMGKYNFGLKIKKCLKVGSTFTMSIHDTFIAL